MRLLATIRPRAWPRLGHMYNRQGGFAEIANSTRAATARLPAGRLGSSSQLGRSDSDTRELLEERELAGNALQGLRVPLNRHDECPLRILYRFDRPVRRPSARPQARAETVDGLVMKRVD